MNLSHFRSWRSMVRTSRTSPSPKLSISSKTTHTSLSLSKPTYSVSKLKILVHKNHTEHNLLQSAEMMTDSPSLWLHQSSLQRAPQPDHPREKERRTSHSQDPGEKREPLLHPWPSRRHGVPNGPQEHPQDEGQHCVRREEQDQEDAGEDSLQYTATQTLQVRWYL